MSIQDRAAMMLFEHEDEREIIRRLARLRYPLLPNEVAGDRFRADRRAAGLGTLCVKAGRRKYRGVGAISRIKCYTAELDWKNEPTRIAYLLYTRGVHQKLMFTADQFIEQGDRNDVAKRLRQARNK